MHVIQLYHSPVSEPSPDVRSRWLMLIHQIPLEPAYLRVKVGRRLSRIGAIALKNTVYLLPRNDAAHEDLQWVLRKVTGAGGEATLLQAHFVDGLLDADVETLFRSARDADYAEVAASARELEQQLGSSEVDDEVRRQLMGELVRLERRAEEIGSIGFFGAASSVPTHGLLAALRTRLTVKPDPPAAPPKVSRDEFTGRTWVTRTGVHIDRIASAS